jgi:hypothetical protein
MRKPLRRDIHVAFPSGEQWYLYPHNELLVHVLAIANVSKTYSRLGQYSFPRLSRKLTELLEPYRLELHQTSI